MQKPGTIGKTFVWTTLFGIAMALIEADVVIYLRLLYYPHGFEFSLSPLRPFTFWVEFGREIGTLVMLLAVANLAGKSFYQRFAWFAYLFGVWDIFYYIWLKIQLDWPATLLDWDLLFLIPLPWLGPVLAPVLISICLIAGALAILFKLERGQCIRITNFDWLLLMFSCSIMIVSFCIDWRVMLVQQLPSRFRWELFLPGLFFGCGVFIKSVFRSQNYIKSRPNAWG